MKADRRLGNLLADLSAGAVVATVTVSYAASYAALVFSGPELSGYLPAGVAAALTSSWIMSGVVALGSSWYFAVGGPDSNLAAVLSVIVPAVMTSLLAGRATPDQIAATLAMVLALSAVASGRQRCSWASCVRGGSPALFRTR